MAAAAALAAPAAAKGLRDAVQQAVETHPEVNALRANNRAVRHELRAARGAYLPSIDARGIVGHVWLNDSTTRSRAGRTSRESGWVDMNRYEAGVSLRQLVFDGLGTPYEVERQVYRVKSSIYRVKDTAQAIALRAIEAYLEVRRTSRIVRAASRNVRVHRAILGRVSARAKGGRGPRSDVDQASARLALARSSLTAARHSYNDAAALYIQAVGERPAKLAKVSAPESALPGNVDAAVNTALAHAPGVGAAIADVKSAKSAIGVATSRFFPRVDVEVAYNYYYNADAFSGDGQEFLTLLVGKWNLYNGGIDTARRREAIARMIESRERLDQARRETAHQTRISWNALNAARARRIAARRHLVANRRVRLAYSRQFDRGQRSLLDLVDIQNEIYNAESTVVTEEYTIKFGVFRVLAAMGKLLEVLQIVLPGEVTRKPSQNVIQGLKDDMPRLRFNSKDRK